MMIIHRAYLFSRLSNVIVIVGVGAKENIDKDDKDDDDTVLL